MRVTTYLVRDLDIVKLNTDDLTLEVTKFNPDWSCSVSGKWLAPSETYREYINSIILRSDGDEEWRVAWSKDVEKALMFPIEALSRQIEEQGGYIEMLNKERVSSDLDYLEVARKLSRFRSLTFWQRLKFLFKGEIR